MDLEGIHKQSKLNIYFLSQLHLNYWNYEEKVNALKVFININLNPWCFAFFKIVLQIIATRLCKDRDRGKTIFPKIYMPMLN